MNCKYVLYASEPSLYKPGAYVIIGPGSLSVEGQEPAFVYVIMQSINKNINTTVCRTTR